MDLTDSPHPAARRRLGAIPARLPRLSFRRRDRGPEAASPAELHGPLRAFRTAALWAVAIVVGTADIAAFSESYRGLFEWAEHHSLNGFWAAAFPLQVDLFIVVGELVLFIAMTDTWGRRDQAGAWAVALLGLAVSVAGNIGHVHAHDLQTRGTAAVPPVAAFGALWLGLGVLKRILRKRRQAASAAAETAQQAAGTDRVTEVTERVTEVLDGLTGAVLLLARRASEPAPAPVETPLLAELLEAVRGLGERLAEPAPGAVSSPVPVDAEDAARIAMEATAQAGNPLSVNQLVTRYGLSRAQATKVRDAVVPVRYAALNGSAAGA